MTRAERRKTHLLTGRYTACNLAVEQIGHAFYDRNRPDGNPLLVSGTWANTTCKVCRRAQ